MNKHLVILLLVISFVITTYAQKRKPPQLGRLYDTGQDNVDKGWFFGIGGTYMWPYLKNTGTSKDTIGTIQDYEAKPTGRLGLFAEIGKFRMNKRKVINYMDYGLAYKWFRGKETFTTNTTYRGIGPFTQEVEGTFSDHVFSLNLNFGHRWDKNHKVFYLNGIGANADLFAITSRKNGGNIYNEEHQFPSTFTAQLHYIFGIGFRVKDRLIVMPTIETPIFGVYPFNHIVSTHDYFNTRYRPILFRVRFYFLKNKSKTCPPVYNPAGLGPDK